MNRDVFRCPRCRGALRWAADAVACDGCASEYPVFHGIADFRISVPIEKKRAEWAAHADLFREDVVFSTVLREAVIRENPDPKVQQVELQYELGWERRGKRALSRLDYLSRRLGASPGSHSFSSVLDIGCGKGSLLGTFAPMAKQLAGIDYSVECIGYSRALMRERGYPECALAAAEAEHLPFETNAFDFVSALDVIEHLADQAEGVREAFRVLKQGHLLFLNSPNRFSVMAPEDHCRLWFVGFIPYRYQRAYVRWKANYNYAGVRLLSYWTTGRLVASHTGRMTISTVPMEGGNDPNDSRLERLLRRSALLRWLLNSTPLKYFAPSHHLLALK